MTQPQVSILCSWSSNISGCLDRLQIRRGSILLLSMCSHALRRVYVGRVDNLLSQVPLGPCFLDGNATSTIPHKYSSRQRDAFECCCAYGACPTSLRGSHVYKINTWLWNFELPQPRKGSLSPAKTEKIRRKTRSHAAKQAWATKQAS